jgi:hypothetical protein
MNFNFLRTNICLVAFWHILFIYSAYLPVRLFTDDNSLIFSSTNPLEVEDRLNLDLHVLDNWAKQWLVDFNPQNTEYMVISFRQNINLKL